nr:hypothetical protein [Tanacetum cinerariifolium]
MSVPVTAKEKTNKKNDVKLRSLLLMALPNEHQLTFNQYTDTKTMFAAIKTRFRGNEATKKTQKALLKQQYENFTASSSESLDSIFNRLQKLVSRLVILGVVITSDDLNSNFLSIDVVVWINKNDIETMSIDDLYNNFKIIEQEVNKSIGASTGSQNMAFMSTPNTSSTNDVNITNPACKVSTNSINVNTSNSSVSTAKISDNVMYAFMVENPNGSNLLQQDLEQIYKDDLEAMDLKECRAPRNKDGQFKYQDNSRNQENSKRIVNGEGTSSKTMLVIDDSEVYTDKSCSKTCLKNYETLKKQCDDLIVKLNDTEFKAATYKRGLATVEEQLVTFRKNEVLFSKEINVLKREVGCKEYEIGMLKTEDNVIKSTFESDKESDNSKENIDESLEQEQVYDTKNSFVESSPNVVKETVFHAAKKVEFVKLKNNEKPVKKSVRYAEMYRSTSPRRNQRNWNGQKSNQLGNEFVMYSKACFVCESFDHVQINCPHHQRKRLVTRNYYNRVDYDYFSKTSHLTTHMNMNPRAVLLKSRLRPLSTGRPVYTVSPLEWIFFNQ